MTVITIDGNMGCGGRDLGIELAKQLKFDYLDRWILIETAQRLGATVDVLSQKEAQTGNINEKLSKVIKNLLERSALVGAGGDPSFGPGINAILAHQSQKYDDSPITNVHDLDDEDFIEATKQVIIDFAAIGNSVIVGRGGCFILKDNSQVIHLGVVALKNDRISRIESRHHMDYKEATTFVAESDTGRAAFMTKYFGNTFIDPYLYDIVINTSKISISNAAKILLQYIQHYR